VVLIAVWGALTLALARRETADVTLLRVTGAPFTVLPSGDVSNAIRVKITNRTDEEHAYVIALADAPDVALLAVDRPVRVPAGGSVTSVVLVNARPETIPEGQRDVRFRVTDDAGFAVDVPYRVLGPTGAARSRS
jgi:hypothetical protein